MMTRQTNRAKPTRVTVRVACILACAVCLPVAHSQSKDPTTPADAATTMDEVVAVVNRQTILKSDIEDELQLSVLDPSTNGREQMSALQALDRLISRTLIQQQIRQEDLPATEPTPAQITARVEEIRNQLPACVRANCHSDEGWKTFLAGHDLTPARVEAYLLNRLEILSFIEMRFRQGIRISPEDVQKYYSETLLPQYPAGQQPPPLAQISDRIEEILLQQQVNALFSTWLANLRKQGQIEVLDPVLESASEKQGARE